MPFQTAAARPADLFVCDLAQQWAFDLHRRCATCFPWLHTNVFHQRKKKKNPLHSVTVAAETTRPPLLLLLPELDWELMGSKQLSAGGGDEEMRRGERRGDVSMKAERFRELYKLAESSTVCLSEDSLVIWVSQEGDGGWDACCCMFSTRQRRSISSSRLWVTFTTCHSC